MIEAFYFLSHGDVGGDYGRGPGLDGLWVAVDDLDVYDVDLCLWI